ncbi:hypothetical protein GCM10023331_00970 [Algivirga pacifica]|uniref:Transposase n=1 Tax=Algivirga pacifica TaxID=1162670 RepID=A0ABP9CVL7_9BACT
MDKHQDKDYQQNAEFKAMRDMALEQLKTGKSLIREGGVFVPLLKQFLNSAIEAMIPIRKIQSHF